MPTETDFSLTGSLAWQARRLPTKLAVSDGTTDLTYGELNRRVDHVTAGLARLGVVPGDRIVFLGRNGVEFFELLFGVARAGGVLVPLNWRLTAAEITGMVADAGARVVFAHAEFTHLLPTVDHLIGLEDDYPAWRESTGGKPMSYEPSPDDVVLQSYTSGTTGLPKGVMVTNRMYETAVQVGDVYGIKESSVAGLPMPVFHVGGSIGGIIAMRRGASAVIPPAFRPEQMLELIERYQVTWMPLAPALLAMMAREQRQHPHDISSWTAATYGGQPITTGLLNEVTAVLDVDLFQGYGMTETAGAITCLRPEDHHGELLTSAGRPFVWVQLAAFDLVTGERLPPGERGEIRFLSEQNTPGYFGRPKETAELFSAAGWIRSGDIGYVDERGYVFLTDRLHDMIITGGENVHPIEVERVLERHPAIREVAVVGEPSEKWGEAVVAFVVVDGGSDVDAEAIIEWSRPRLAGFHRPQRVQIVPELPRSPEGKLIRADLKGALWSGHGRTIG